MERIDDWLCRGLRLSFRSLPSHGSPDDRPLLSLPLVPARERRVLRVDALIESDRMELLSGAVEVIDTPSNSGKGQRISRCPSCRIALWSNYSGAGDTFLFVRIGTLDEPDLWPPDIHIFTESKQPWVVLPAGVPAFPIYYDREQLWPAESLERRTAALARTTR